MLRRNFLKAALAVLAAPMACLAQRKVLSTKEGTLAPGWTKESEAGWKTPYTHWSDASTSTPLADIKAMRDKIYANSIGWRSDFQ